MVTSLSILGSTGSIGRQSLAVAAHLGIPVAAIAARRDTALLERQARQFRPRIAAVFDEDAAADLRVRLADTDVRVLPGMDGLMEAAADPAADCVVTAVSGSVGLRPTLTAIDEGKRIALANKETLVCAGELVMSRAALCGAEIVPVDSEHSAIFQSLGGVLRHPALRRVLLTASGGPFRGMTKAETYDKTPAEALRHPNWSMGAKITVDSATMMNKGLEFIEAMHLFGAAPEQICILIHPESVVHSGVEFCDGSVLVQMAVPDMVLPIQYAMAYPDRAPSLCGTLDLAAAGALHFSLPDPDNTPCLALAMAAAARGGTAPCILSAANEAAVALFLRERIPFGAISECIAAAMDSISMIEQPTLEEILEADGAARNFVSEKY
jgi:1-deoxy-D-xylulose-5-phosphate reductoisomerase